MKKTVLKIKSKIVENNKHRFVILGYAIATLFACLIALSDNNQTQATISRNDSLGHLLLLEGQDTNFETEQSLYSQSSIENMKSLFDMVALSGPEHVVNTVSIKKGDTMASILRSVGLNSQETYEINKLLAKHIDPRSLKIGHKFEFLTLRDDETNDLLLLERLVYEPTVGTRYILSLDEDNNYFVEKEVDEHILELKTAKGSIDGMLSTSMQKQGVPNSMVAEFTKIFSNTVDFGRDIQKGDTFEVIYESYISSKGNFIKNGNILYLSLTLRKDKIALYRFKDSKGNVDYFDNKGYAYSNKTLYRKPLAFQKARVSSPFGRRRHPVHKDIRIHWGIDYAAPRGTAVYAAGDGVVQVRKYNGGYGKYIKIRHNSEYKTAYAHLNGYAKGIVVGKRVKRGQVIGYVGNTGVSTGPHLHYEVIKGGRRVNPATIKASTGENLKGNIYNKFKTHMAEFEKSHPQMFASAAQ